MTALIGWSAVIAGGALAVWYARRGVRAENRWPAVLGASESLAVAALVALIGSWADVPWWVWWIVASPAVIAAALMAWRWPELGTERPRWARLNLTANAVAIVACVVAALLPPG